MKPPTRPINKTKEAFQEGANLICLATAAAAALALVNPLPLLGVAVVEAAYLLFVPDSKWYDARLVARTDQAAIKKREELKTRVWNTMDPDLQTRFNRLDAVRSQIARESYEGKRWFREVVRKMDYLMEKFLLFASKKGEFVAYLNSLRQELGINPRNLIKSTRSGAIPDESQSDEEWVKTCVANVQNAYLHEISSVEEQMKTEQNPHNSAILDKRHEVLDRRQQYVTQIGDILLNIDQQIKLIEDTFGLINDEIRARSPDQVLADIDDVVFQTDNLSETLQEVSPFDPMTSEGTVTVNA